MRKIHLILLLIVVPLFAEGDSTWCVMLNNVYHHTDTSVNQKLLSMYNDSLTFFDKHFCHDTQSREYFTLMDSLVPGVYIGEPEAFYSEDTLPSVDFRLWLSTADSSLAFLLAERYRSSAVKDNNGVGPGLPGEWNTLLPMLFHERVEAEFFLNSLRKESGPVPIGYALITTGEYLFFGSCLSQPEAEALALLLRRYGLPLLVCRIQYQHIDI